MTVDELRTALQDAPGDALVLVAGEQGSGDAYRATALMSPARSRRQAMGFDYWNDSPEDALAFAESDAEQSFEDLARSVVIFWD